MTTSNGQMTATVEVLAAEVHVSPGITGDVPSVAFASKRQPATPAGSAPD